MLFSLLLHIYRYLFVVSMHVAWIAKLTAKYSWSLSIKSARRYNNRPRSDAFIVLHGLPSLNAS